MKKEELEKFKDKKILIKTKDHFTYTILVSEVTENFIEGVDKYEMPIQIDFSDIKSFFPLSISGLNFGND